MKWYDKVNHVAIWVIRIVSSAIFLFLTWYAMRYTQYILPGDREIPSNVQDSMAKNILFAVLVVAVMLWLLVLERRVNSKVRLYIEQISAAVAMGWIGGLGFWWILSMDRRPYGDQAFIYGGASYFLEGQYSFLGKGGYCYTYPHQLVLIALMELLFLVVGTYNYFAFQVICTVMAVGIVYVGWQIVRELTDSMAVTVMYCLFMMGCLPLVFYTAWVYGDIPSIFFMLLAVRQLLRYMKNGKWISLAGMSFATVMSLLVRKNSLIFVIALSLTALVHFLRSRDWKLILALLCTIITAFLVYEGVYKMYEVRSGYPHSDGLPAVTWIDMGLCECEGTYGWYDDTHKGRYYELNFDREMTSAIAKQNIKEHLRTFLDSPSYAWHFFREKLLSQWNQPLCQSLYFNARQQEGELQGTLPAEKLSEEYFVQVLAWNDRLQFAIYLGMLCYCLFAIRKDRNILEYVLTVTVIGGFLFSMIWEAKARYVLPYYITIFFMSAIGYWQLVQTVMSLFDRGKKREQIADIREVRKSA